MPEPIRALARWITIVQLVGYTTSLVFIRHTTGLTAAGIAERYRGADPDAAESAMQFPKSFAEMLTITHTHLFSMAAIFVFSGLVLALCSRPSERWRRILIVEPFVALLVSFWRCGSCGMPILASAGSWASPVESWRSHSTCSHSSFSAS